MDAINESGFLRVIEFLPPLPSKDDRLLITGVLTKKREFFLWFASSLFDKKLSVTVPFGV